MIKRVYMRVFVLILFFLGAGLVGLALFLPRLIDVNVYREDIITTFQQALNRKVSFTHGEFSMSIGPTFTFDNVSIKEPDGVTDFLVARRISLRLALLPLLEKKAVLKNIVVDNADVHIVRNRDGRLNIDDLLASRTGIYQLHLRKVQINNGVLHWRDNVIHPRALLAEARFNTLIFNGVSRGHKGSVKLDCQIPAQSGTSGLISLSGSIRLPDVNRSLFETELNMACNIKQFEVGRFWPYYGRFIPFGSTGGRVDLETTFKGKLREFKSKGMLRLSNVTVDWPKVFHHPVNPRLAQLEYEFLLAKDSIDMPVLQFSTEGFKVRGSCRLQDIRSKDLRITARASSDPFRLEMVRQWIPYGIIATDASRYIEEHITGGLFTLESGLLDGRISQIAHMERGSNYNVLRIRGSVENGVLSYGPKVPAFTNIKAGLDLLGRDFIISRGTATFGKSPFRLSGKITDYPLVTPCQYPFEMEMNPQATEVVWLARLSGAHRLEYFGGSRLILRGSGGTSSYKLSGEWDLKPAAYSFPGAVRKPAGIRNGVEFSATLSPGSAVLSSLTYTLSPMSISAKAQLAYNTRPHLNFELQTNQFYFSEALPILSMWQTYHPRGRVQAHIKGSGNPVDFTAMDYSGSIFLHSFALQPGEKLRPVSNINGAITLKGNGLETSRITVYYGSSLINAKGRLNNFGNPEAELVLSSPELYLRDVSFMTSRPDASIRRMFASLAIRDGTYTIRGFSGQINSTSFNVSGSYTGGAFPAANLSVFSPHIDLNELLVLAKQGGDASGSSRTDLKLRLVTDSGKYEKVQFGRMKLTLSRDSGVTYIQELDAGLYGGKLTAKGRIAPDMGRINRYDLTLDLERVNSERLFRALDVSHEVTGSLGLHGSITARGSTMPDIRKSALGNVRLNMETGKLRRFSVLSKLFSVLNFSQLLKFQLPDMVHNGMPYNEIRATLSVRDGVVTTQDMFIGGDAINISVIGSTNIVSEELDFTIGVQPLQTVDKVVNRIPVVGWLLTGKNNAVVTAYFEARGKWADPQVTAIPVKSMSKGALKIFRRMFELPVRLFTDTGEVLLGE